MSSLNATQLAALKAAIVGNTTLAAFVSAGNQGGLADFANAVPTTGITTILRPSISVDELKGAIVWSDFMALTVPKQQTYLAMTAGSFVDATKPNITSGFTVVFGAGSASLAALSALASRNATRFEALFAVNSVSPVFGQQLSIDDINKAMALP